jgi:hypothetical protein
LSIGGEGPLKRAPGGNKTKMDILGEIALLYNAPIY